MGSCHQKSKISLNITSKVYNAKTIIMLKGLKYVLKSPMARITPKIHIYLDNLKVACNTSRIFKSSS